MEDNTLRCRSREVLEALEKYFESLLNEVEYRAVGTDRVLVEL